MPVFLGFLEIIRVVVLKNKSDYGIHTYSLEALDSMPDILNQLLKRIEHKDENIINELRNGYNYACSDFSWKHWTRKWISLLTAYGYN